MAGSFTSPSSATPKMKYGKGGLDQAKARQRAKPEYPITDSFGSKTIPSFASRRAHTNAKSGWNTKPARPPAGRLAKRPLAPSRGSGTEHRQKGK